MQSSVYFYFFSVLLLVHYGNALVYSDGQTSVKWLEDTQGADNKDVKCKIYEEGFLPSVSPDEGFVETDSLSMSNLVDECMQIQGLSQSSHHKASKRSLFNILDGIYPGTNWCGDGNIANETDLGYYNLTDACCKEHDNCNIFISSGQRKYGIYNNQQYTMCSCECDARFRECLDNVNSFTSKAVGSLFFNVVQIHCVELIPEYTEGRLSGVSGKLVAPKHYGLLPKKQVTFDQVVSGESSVFSWLGGFFGK